VTSRYDVWGASLGSEKFLRAAEVADAELASVSVDEYVRRLDVAVGDPIGMQIAKAGQELEGKEFPVEKRR
jgi:hypothetical protein